MKNGAMLIAFIFFGGLSIPSLLQGAHQDKSDTVTIRRIEPFAYLCLEYKGPFSQVQEAFTRMAEEARHQNALPIGPLMTISYGIPEQDSSQDLQWELGFPVTPQSLIQPPLMKKAWSYTQVAVSLHQGAYGGIGETVARMLRWMENNGLELAGPIVERYLYMSPAEVSPEQRKTEVWIPCRKKT